MCLYLMAAPRYTPWFQLLASRTRGIVVGRLPPNRIAEIGTPAGSSHAGSITGHCPLGVQNLQLQLGQVGVKLTIIDVGTYKFEKRIWKLSFGSMDSFTEKKPCKYSQTWS